MAIFQDEIDYIDQKSKNIKYKSGKVVPLSEEAAFSLFASPGARGIKEGVKETELDFQKGLGSVNTFLKNASDNVFTRLATDYVADPLAAGFGAISKREGQEDMGFFGRLGENYVAQRMGRREARESIDQDSPGAALLGKAGSIGIDLAMPLGRLAKSPAAMGAVYGAGSSDRSLIEDPGEFAKSTSTGAALGYGVGKVGSALEKVAEERRALREFPELERSAQKQYQQKLQDFRATVREKIGASEKEIGKFGIPKSIIDIDNFIAREIGTSQMATTKEAAELEKFLRTIEKNLPENLYAGDLQRLYEAIEIRSAAAGLNIKPVYDALKEHLVDRLPMGAAQNKLMGTIAPRVQREILKSIDSVTSKIPKNTFEILERELGKGAVKKLKSNLDEIVNNSFKQMSPQEFISFIKNGESKFVSQVLSESPLYQNMANLTQYFSSKSPWLVNTTPVDILNAEMAMKQLPGILETSIGKVLKKNAIDASILVEETQRNMASRLSNATGVVNPYTQKIPTNVPVEPYQPPTPPKAGRLATRFETSGQNVSGEGGQAFGLAAMGKLFGIPKVGAALAAGKGLKVGLEGLLRGITSPTAMGNLTREAMKTGGLRVMVGQIANSYSSYEDGIIKDPRERQIAVSEIETNGNLELEDKAILQAYINRGKNLQKLIRD